MIHYNRNNNAYCRAVNAETFKTIEHNPVWISILLYTRNPYSYSHFEIVICIHSVRGDIDQISTNTPSYTICSAPNVYIFVYILIETRIAPLKAWGYSSSDHTHFGDHDHMARVHIYKLHQMQSMSVESNRTLKNKNKNSQLEIKHTRLYLLFN